MKKKKNKLELDEFYYHEMLDRLTLVADIIDRHLIEHPVSEKHPKLKKKLNKCFNNLIDIYQKIPNLY
jgi:hypothetical protein